MAQALKLKMTMDLDDITRAFDRMRAHFEAAPDDDPAKLAMAAFGEVDTEKHLPVVSDYANGVISVRCAPCPELQRIMDMVPA
jgi:hypothetical protein